MNKILLMEYIRYIKEEGRAAAMVCGVAGSSEFVAGVHESGRVEGSLTANTADLLMPCNVARCMLCLEVMMEP